MGNTTVHPTKGQTYEQYHGPEKAAVIKQKMSTALRGRGHHSWLGKKGPLCPNWRGGRWKLLSGHIRVWTPHGYILEHRLVMEKMLGRKLLPNEDVHHINGIKDDNRPENLKVQQHGDHAANQWVYAMERIAALEQRVTILEAENILLKEQAGCRS